MTALRIIGKLGSKSRLAITKGTGIPKYKNSSGVSAIINYGLAGKRLEAFYKNCPTAKRVPTLNRHIARSKYAIIKDAEAKSILVPDTRIELTSKMDPSDWIEKKFHSIGGIGIKKARGRRKLADKYYQKFIDKRVYELRVHAFKWIDPEDWVIQKRIGDKDVIAWNYKQGGTFQTVHNKGYAVFKNALEITDKILDMRNMAFGAVDFIVDSDREVYFIEINAAPGFTELSEPIYTEAFKKLKSVSDKKIMGMCTC